MASKNPSSARVLTIASGKGGVGKTTTATGIAAVLAASGQQTLLIDAEPQQNAALALLSPDLEPDTPGYGDPYGPGVADVLTMGGKITVESITPFICASRIEGLDVLPAGDLDTVQSWLSGQRASELFVRNRIVEPLDVGFYKWIVIDMSLIPI